jgi:hypothetical protein
MNVPEHHDNDATDLGYFNRTFGPDVTSEPTCGELLPIIRDILLSGLLRVNRSLSFASGPGQPRRQLPSKLVTRGV